MPKNFLRTFIIGTAFVLFFLFGAVLYLKGVQHPKLPVLGQVQNFKLYDAEGKPFELKNLSGKVWIADFFFTTCSDICPMLSKNMAALSRTFELENGVALVSITVNPEFDSPDVLTKYRQTMKSKNPRWYFLTGTREDITKLAVESFKLGSVDQPIFHSGKFALVDRYGLIRGFYDGTEKEALNQIFKDASRLLNDR